MAAVSQYTDAAHTHTHTHTHTVAGPSVLLPAHTHTHRCSEGGGALCAYLLSGARWGRDMELGSSDPAVCACVWNRKQESLLCKLL